MKYVVNQSAMIQQKQLLESEKLSAEQKQEYVLVVREQKQKP